MTVLLGQEWALGPGGYCTDLATKAVGMIDGAQCSHILTGNDLVTTLAVQR